MTTDTEPIYETDLEELQYPWTQIDEMDAVERGLAAGRCCNVIPCRTGGMECPR